VIEALQNPNEWVVIDTRAENEFNGDRSASGAFGTGRLKDAVHIDWVRNHDSNEIMLPEAELRALYNFVGDRKVIVYCQGGVRSAYSWIVLRDLGFDVWNYDGSWIEWSYAASSASNYARKAEVLSLTESWTDNGRAF
jgi:thiosulfate/3-mercaptopyruvate sulfurtransferase